MNGLAKQQGPGATGLELVVSTWHIARLHDNAQPEGLPTDLLTKHSALFYLVDRVVCDTYGLQGELKWDDYWLSAKMFKKLKCAGLLREVDLHGEPYLPAEFWDQLKASDTGRFALRQMDQISSKLAELNDRELQGIDAFLLTLNRTLFLSLRFSNNWLPYYQTDAYFKADPARHFELAAVPGTATGDMRWRGQRISRLIELIEKHLPDPMLLPPPASRSMKHALTRLTNLEKRELYKVIYGTMSHENFRDFRRDKKKFQTWDEKIDTRIREDEANRNFERLMTIREQTKDVRKNLQLTVVKIVDGEIPMRDACALVSSQVDQLRDHVNGTLPWSYRGARLLASELPADLLEFYLAQTVPNYPQAFGIIGPMWAAGPIVFKPLIDYVDTSFIQRFVRNRRMKRARPNYPLAALNQDLTEILQEGFKLELGR